MRALILCLLIKLCAHVHALGQSKGIAYSISAHFHGPMRYDILLGVQSDHHQVLGGYFASQLGTFSDGEVTYPGLNFGYRYYPGKNQRKVNGFFSADLFAQSYRSSKVSSETTLVAFGGGVRYTPVSRLYIEAAIGFGPYWYEYVDSGVIVYGTAPKPTTKGSIRLGVAYRFN